MAQRCVLCGREYSRKVTTAHLKSHKTNRKKYDKMTAQLPQQAWDFYWMDMNSYLRRLFPDPIDGGTMFPRHPLCVQGITSFKRFLRQFYRKYNLQDCADIQA